MAGAQTAKPDTENKKKIMATRGAEKFVSQCRELLHTKQAISNVIFYELSEAIEAKKLGFEQDLPSYIDTNVVGLPCPSIYFGTSEFKKKAREYADAVAEKIYDFFLETASPADVKKLLENDSLKGASISEKSEIIKGYLLLDHLIHISPEESKNLTKEQQVKMLMDLKDFVHDKITSGNSESFFKIAIPHIKYDTKKDVYKSHLHCKISSINFNGEKLDLHNIGLRMNWAMIEAENSSQFDRVLQKTNTQAAERNFMPKSQSEYDAFRKHIGNILYSKTKLEPEQVSYRLKKKGIDIVEMPSLTTFIDEDGEKKYKEHESAKRFIAMYAGKMYDIKYLRDSDSQKIRATVFHESATTEMKNSIDLAKEIILSKDNIDFKSINTALESKGIFLLPNITKTGKVQGFSVLMNNGETRTTLSNMQLTLKDLKIDITNQAHINELKELRVKNLSITNPNKKRKMDETTVSLSGYGKNPIYKKRKLMMDYGSIDEWMSDNAGSYSITLKKYYYFDESTNSFLHKKYNSPIFKITEQSDTTLKTSFQGSSLSSATALVQMYLENGYSGMKISGDSKKCSLIWRAAMQKGVSIEGYSPSSEDLEWFKEERAKQVSEVRNANRKAFEAFQQTGKAFDIKVVSNTYKEVDRGPIAYAFVDLLNAGMNPLQVLNPPKKSKNKATPEDLLNQYEKIIEIVREECPEKISSAEQFLKTYKPVDTENAVRQTSKQAQTVEIYKPSKK